MSEKILDRIAKLLAIREGRGATEAEALIAQEHVQRLLQEHNLTLSQVEQHAGSASQPISMRRREELKFSASQQWRIDLMEGIANNSFCLARTCRTFDGKRHRTGYQVIGREVNVTVTKMSYEYLVEALLREMRSQGYRLTNSDANWNKEGTYFMEGAVERVVARLDQRRREQEQESAQTHIEGNGTHRELVLSDVYGSEADLNNDMLNNFPPGTTAARRRAAAEKEAARAAEEKRLIEEEGMERVEAFYRSHGYNENVAKTFAADWNRSSRARGYSTRWSRGERARYRKMNSDAYKLGCEAGSRVSLDPQVTAGSQRKLPCK